MKLTTTREINDAVKGARSRGRNLYITMAALSYGLRVWSARKYRERQQVYCGNDPHYVFVTESTEFYEQ